MDLVTPRFRTDLVAQPIEEEGQRLVDVTDPESGSAFKFYEVEYSIACAMDGQRSLDALAGWAEAELGLATSADELRTLVDTLADLGYLDGAPELAPTDMSQEYAAPPAVQPGADVALGAAGGSTPDFAAPPVQPSNVELGAPGMAADAVPGMVDDGATAANPAPGSAADMSFEGLLGEQQPMAQPDDSTIAEPDDIAVDGLDEGPTNVRAQTDDGPTNVVDRAALTGADPTGGLAEQPPIMTPPGVPMTPPAALGSEPSQAQPGAFDGGLPAPGDAGPPMPEVAVPGQAPSYSDDDVSVDLSQHLSVDRSTLKEAVRQSQVMTAVDVPPELMAELGHGDGTSDEPPTIPVDLAGTQPAPVMAPPGNPAAGFGGPPPPAFQSDLGGEGVLPQQPPGAAGADYGQPTEISMEAPYDPNQPGLGAPTEPSLEPVAESAGDWQQQATSQVGQLPDRSRVSPSGQFPQVHAPEHTMPVSVTTEKPRRLTTIILSFILVTLVGAGVGYYFLIYKPAQEESNPVANGSDTPKGPTTTPTAPKAAKAKLALSGPGDTPVSMPKDGILASVLSSGIEVKQGDVIASLRGNPRVDAKLKNLTDRLAYYQRKLVKAQDKLQKSEAAGAKGAKVKALKKDIKRYTSKVEQKQVAKAKLEADNQANQIKAAAAGVLEVVAKTGKRLAKGETFATIKGKQELVGDFEVPNIKAFTLGGEVELQAVSKPEVTSTCTIEKLAAGRVSVACKGDTPFLAGGEVQLALP